MKGRWGLYTKRKKRERKGKKEARMVSLELKKSLNLVWNTQKGTNEKMFSFY